MSEKNVTMTDDSVEIAEMTADLEEYYECAGFADFHNKVLKDMSDDQIRAYHKTTFCEEDMDF